MRRADLVLDFLAVHLGVCEISEDAAQVLPGDVAGVSGVIECEGVFDLVFLSGWGGTMSSESLLLRLLDLEPLALLTFFFMPFISYKNIIRNLSPHLNSPLTYRPIFDHMIIDERCLE